MLQLLNIIGDIVWDGVFLPCVLVGGGLLTALCGGIQLRRLPLVLKKTGGQFFVRRRDDPDGISPVQAACTALASTVGTGNIVGTAQAISMGGPGAVFWMWAAALLGMVIKYAEVCLAVRYRCKGSDGELTGGPMYYLELGLGKSFRPLAVMYALLAALAAFGIGNMSQLNSAADAVEHAAVLLLPGTDPSRLRLIFGLLAAVLTAAVLLGGAKRVGRVAETLVPVMSIGFILLSSAVMVCHFQALGQSFILIFRSAFTPSAALGGAVGIGARETIRWGLRRSAFSNEAGLGSAAIAHAPAKANSPVEQGFWGIFEVFADTIVICSVTAITILCSGVGIDWGVPAGPELLANAYMTVFSPGLTAVFMAFSMTLFAFSSVLGWAVLGKRCVQYIFPRSRGILYQLLFSAAAVVGCVSKTELVWAVSDVLNALMAIPNFTALFLLSGEVRQETRAYFSKY